MDAVTLAILILGCGWLVLSAILWRLLRSRPRPSGSAEAAVVLLQGQIEALREQVRSSLDTGRQALDRRLEETNRVVGEVRQGLGAVDRQVRSVADAARDLRGLQELMRSPKVRGGLGETLLAELLAQVMPHAHFELQFEFAGGERVDAVLRVGERLVPVDAKFPLDNFRRIRSGEIDEDERLRREARRAFRADVRRHVDAVARKYIRPGQGTYEFAMLYVPAEAVYQEMLAQEGEDGLDLFHYALNRQVVPVSPQSFYAYLQVIVMGLRGLTLEGRARQIVSRLGSIRTRLDRFTESFELALRHTGNAQRQMEEAARRLARLDAAFDVLARGDEAEEDQNRNDRPIVTDVPLRSISPSPSKSPLSRSSAQD